MVSLPCLQNKGIITDTEYRFIWSFQIRFNENLYWVEWRTSDASTLILSSNPVVSCSVKPLEENDQQHIVMYIMSAGQDSDSEDRVLDREEIAMIDDNMFCLVNLIDPYRRNFLNRLVKKTCITIRHREKIEKFPEASKKVEELLKIIKRRRYRDLSWPEILFTWHYAT